MFVNPLYTSTQQKILALFNVGSNSSTVRWNGVLCDFNGFIDRLARINTHVGFLSIDAVGDPCSRLSNLFQDTLFFKVTNCVKCFGLLCYRAPMWMSLDWSHIRGHADVQGRPQSSQPCMDILKGIHDNGFSQFYPGDRHMGHTHLTSHVPLWTNFFFIGYSTMNDILISSHVPCTGEVVVVSSVRLISSVALPFSEAGLTS